MHKKKTRNYDVGYGRPPKATQFQRGRSGNPAGRPKGSKNVLTQLLSAANEKITVTVNGKAQRMSKFQAICMQVVNNAVKGDARAQKLAFDLLQRVDDRAGVGDIIKIVISPTDAKL